MKKILVIVLLVPILALTMISCDADMRSNLANLMGGFNSNVLIDGGLVKVNNANAEAAAAAIQGIGTGTGAETIVDGGGGTGTTSSMGLSVSVAADTKLLAPQTPDKQKTLKTNLAAALNSPDQKKNLLADLSKPVNNDNGQIDAAKGTVTVFNLTLTALAAGLPADSDLAKTFEKLQLPVIKNGDTVTQGDLLTLQLMTDLISNTIASLKEIGGGDGLAGVDASTLGSSGNKAKVLSIVDDALFAAEIAEQISGAASIDFTGQINLGDLMNSLGDKSSRSRGEAFALTDAVDFIGTINALAPSIVDLMGITYDGTDFVYDAAKYKSFLLNQQIYRSAMDQALKMMELGNLTKKDVDKLTFDTSTLVKYALAVFITEHHAFWESEYLKDSSATAPNVVIATYLNETDGNKRLGLGTLSASDSLTQPDATKFTKFDYANMPGFLKAAPRNLNYFTAILNNIIAINNAGGIAQLTTELKKFRDAASDKDGLTKWFNEL